jgi:hypothetical protein
MSSVVDVSADGKGDDERATRDPFAGSRIEVDESQLRAVSPAAWLVDLKGRLDETMSRLIYGR